MRGFEIIEKVYNKGWPCAVLVTPHRVAWLSELASIKFTRWDSALHRHHGTTNRVAYRGIQFWHQYTKKNIFADKSPNLGGNRKLLQSVFCKYFVDISIYIDVKIAYIWSPTCLNCSSKLQFCWVPKSEGLLDWLLGVGYKTIRVKFMFWHILLF